MLEKNKEKQERKNKRVMWTGYYQRKTKTKRSKELAIERKHRGHNEED